MCDTATGLTAVLISLLVLCLCLFVNPLTHLIYKMKCEFTLTCSSQTC